MKPFTPIILCVLFSFVGQVTAQCNTGRITQGLANTLAGNTVCGTGAGPQNTGDHWQEFHDGQGNNSPLIEWARGTDPIDPTRQVGTWAAPNGNSTTSTVTYNYTGGDTYIFAVYNNGNGTYSFCDGVGASGGGTEQAIARLQSGQGACTSFP